MSSTIDRLRELMRNTRAAQKAHALAAQSSETLPSPARDAYPAHARTEPSGGQRRSALLDDRGGDEGYAPLVSALQRSGNERSEPAQSSAFAPPSVTSLPRGASARAAVSSVAVVET